WRARCACSTPRSPTSLSSSWPWRSTRCCRSDGRDVSDSSQPPVSTRSIPIDDGQRWRAFWVCVAVAAFTILDISKVNVGLPSIQAALGGGSTELQLVVSGYILAFGLGLVPFGRIGDQRSRRTLMIVGLS